MSAIADSDAAREDRVFSQHQAALTLLQSRVQAPDCDGVRWLDLACGRGQIIRHLGDVISDPKRSLLHYCGFDIEQGYTAETESLAESLGLASCTTHVGELRTFTAALPANERYDFITLTNTIHEVAPRHLAGLLTSSVLRLAPSGSLFVYDMEMIDPPELGAVPWTAEEVRKIVHALMAGFECPDSTPEVAKWQHTRTTGWNFHLERQHVPATPEVLEELWTQALESTALAIRGLLETRLAECRKALRTLTRFGCETGDEATEKRDLLYQFWAVSYALEDLQ